MNSGTYYLYEYKNDKKIRNVGFMKLTQHYHSCILQLTLRPIPNFDKLTLALFYNENNQILSHPLTQVSCQNHAASARLALSESDFPSNFTLKEVDGFLLSSPQGQIYAVSVSEIPFHTEKIRQASETANENTEPEDNEKLEKAAQTDSEIIHMPSPKTESFPQESVCSVEKPEIQEIQEIQEAPQKSSSAASGPTARKILRSELSVLPRKYWNLANNSFLLHGYHNYKHLLLIEEDGQWWLGVPGIYHPREAHAAELFGFPQFTKSYTDLLNLDKEERNDAEEFGHWCRWLK